jgi:ubiquinone/menaquinone biosynthesis C-methylase UbiE
MADSLSIFRALADPTRLRIMALLRKMELSVGELAQVLGQSQPRVSRHIRILCDARLALRRKEGSWVFLIPGTGTGFETLFSATEQIAAGAEGDHWHIADEARLAAVRADRAAAAQVYFNSHAADWDEIRSLHVAESEVELAIRDLLAGEGRDVLLDIGTGTGRMLELLGEQFNQLVGVDRNPEMLRLARVRLSESANTEWALHQADISAVPVETGSVDTVIIHQVLHYVQSPELAIKEAARVLKPGGQLLIVDFAPHDREELRDKDAHARLGFSDEQISGWLSSAGIVFGDVRELVGGALTVKLWLAARQSDARLKVISK